MVKQTTTNKFARQSALAAMIAAFLFFPARALGVRAQQAQPPSSDAANEYFLKKDWSHAAKAYEELTAKEANNGRAWFRLGYSLHSMGMFEKAVGAYQRAEAIGHNPVVMYNLACAYARLGKADDAFSWLGKAGAAPPQQLASDSDLLSLHSDSRWAALIAKSVAASKPCSVLAEARQFDFWVGDWQVENTQGQVVGQSSIQNILGDCVIFENWSGAGGGAGKSFNVYNKVKKMRQQTWVDSQGGIIEFVNGKFEDNKMQFEADSFTPGGQPIHRRLTFFNLGPDKVRQLSEQTTDGGKTWQVEYDFIYIRKR